MRTRIVPTVSGKKAIQVVSKLYGKVTVHKHIGTFSTLEQKAHLLKEAENFIVRTTGQTNFFDLVSSVRPFEIAGMVASALMDVNTRLEISPYVLETGGMGADLGFTSQGKKVKVINASTLSAIVLSSLGIPTLKHGGHANTSIVGSVETIEYLGVHIYQDSTQDIKNLLKKTNFYFSATQVAKTIHDLTHSPFGLYETITHLIGPMTPPISKKTVLHKVFGINQSANPETIAKAYEILKEKGYFNIGNVAIVSGLNRYIDKNQNLQNYYKLKKYMCLDEVSPFSTLLGIVQAGKYKGLFLVRPSDFGAKINMKVLIDNNKEKIILANKMAIDGENDYLSNYLAINAALGLFVAEYLSKPDAIKGKNLNNKYLKECYQRCRLAIKSGNAAAHLTKIRDVSQAFL